MGLIGKRERQQLPDLGGGDDLGRPIRHALRQCCIKGHEFSVNFYRVCVHCREDRGVLVQVEIGLVGCQLRGVNRLQDGELVLFQVAPRFRAEAFAFPKRRVGKPLGATDEYAADVPLEPTIGYREPELLAIHLVGE